jgi:ribosomal protein L22
MERQVAEKGFSGGKEKLNQASKKVKQENQDLPVKKEETKAIEAKTTEPLTEIKTEKKETKKSESKTKKEAATVIGRDLPLSTKTSGAICRFIKFKNPEEAIKQLEKVQLKQIAIPFRGEIPHRKGFRGGYSRGRYPIKTAGYFIKLLKSLNSNAKNNNMDTAIIKITIAKADLASRPTKPSRMSFGRKKFKRAHIYIEAREMPNNKIKQKKKDKK